MMYAASSRALLGLFGSETRTYTIKVKVKKPYSNVAKCATLEWAIL